MKPGVLPEPTPRYLEPSPEKRSLLNVFFLRGEGGKRSRDKISGSEFRVCAPEFPRKSRAERSGMERSRNRWRQLLQRPLVLGPGGARSPVRANKVSLSHGLTKSPFPAPRKAKRWEEIQAAEGPPARHLHTSACAAGQLLVFGGDGPGARPGAAPLQEERYFPRSNVGVCRSPMPCAMLRCRWPLGRPLDVRSRGRELQSGGEWFLLMLCVGLVWRWASWT